MYVGVGSVVDVEIVSGGYAVSELDETTVSDEAVAMNVGSNPTDVSDPYVAPLEFTGQIRKIEIPTERARRPNGQAAAEFPTAIGTQ
jgi:hypothetical protein